MASIIKQPKWIAYTPTVTAGTGTFTAASATGRYCKIGTVCHFQVYITITTNGTAATDVTVTLPFVAADYYFGIGRSWYNNQVLQGIIYLGEANLHIVNNDNTYPGSTGAELTVNGTYETV